MKIAINQFRANVSYVRNLGAVHAAIKAQTTPVIDLSDILRAQIVMIVSALDHYIHEAVRLGMLEIYQGKRVTATAFQRFNVSLESVSLGLNSPTSSDWLENEIRNRHGWQSFQHPDKIADGIRLISDLKLWEEVAKDLGKTARDVKDELNLIIDRRNKIAHEADIDPTVPGERWPIDELLVRDAVTFIEQVVETIHSKL